MKTRVLLVVFFVLMLAVPVFAQDLPDTAAEGLEWLAVAIVALSGLIATKLTEALARMPFLSDADKDKIRRPLLNLVAGVISIGSAYLMMYGGDLAGFLDSSGLWNVVVWAWPAAVAWFTTQKAFGKSVTSA